VTDTIATSDSTDSLNGPRSWRIVSLLCAVACIAYLVRTDVAVAQERMAPALGLTMTAMGAITAWGFQLSYALLQVPAGLFGERFGVRAALALAMLGCGLASLITGVMPASVATGALIGTRVLLGVAQAAVFPVAALAVSQFAEVGSRTRAMALVISASALGAAIAPLLMAPVMEQFGWRAVFLLSATLAAATAVLCRALLPAKPPTTTTSERSERMQPVAGFAQGARQLLRDANLLRLSVAYLLHSAVYFVFVFWFFRYLTEGRGFTILESGVWASLPNIAGFVAAPIIGAFVDRLGARIGGAKARRRVAMACLLSAAVCVLTGALVPSAILSIVALSLSSASLNGAESPFFTSATAIGAPNAGAAAGFLNLMGNLGGVLSIWLAPQMSASWGWNGTLVFWAGVAVVAALLWLTVRVDEHETSTR
jgi:MFS transporter, ACS family, glucarate transporter